MFTGRTDAIAETPILWSPDVKNWLIGKNPDAGKDCRQEEKGMTEDEMVGWHHRLDGREFEQASGVGDGQGSLVCCGPWGHKESDTTECLNWVPEYYPRTHYVSDIGNIILSWKTLPLTLTELPILSYIWGNRWLNKYNFNTAFQVLQKERIKRSQEHLQR